MEERGSGSVWVGSVMEERPPWFGRRWPGSVVVGGEAWFGSGVEMELDRWSPSPGSVVGMQLGSAVELGMPNGLRHWECRMNLGIGNAG